MELKLSQKVTFRAVGPRQRDAAHACRSGPSRAQHNRARRRQRYVYTPAIPVLGPRLSHYEILAKVGEGGMGVVYKARDTHLDRFVAIKVLPPERVADPERKRRFVQEAKAASALNHPHIVVIHDIASADGADFMVMEYVAGRTLDHAIQRKGM